MNEYEIAIHEARSLAPSTRGLVLDWILKRAREIRESQDIIKVVNTTKNEDGSIDFELEMDSITYTTLEKSAREKGISISDMLVTYIKEKIEEWQEIEQSK
jgi:hypothetical protein